MHVRLLQAGILATVTLASAPPLGAAPDPDGPLLEWRFDGGLADSSGQARAAVASGPIAYADSPRGQCLSLDGSGGFVSSARPLPELAGAFTVECWVRPAETQRPYADVFGNHENGFTGFAFQQDGEQTNRYYFTYGTGSGWVYSRTIALAPSVWQHVAVAKSVDRLRVYVDGLLVDSQPAPAPMATSRTPFMAGLGIAGQPRWFRGEVDEVRVFASARRPSVAVTPEREWEVFSSANHVDVVASSEWGLLAPGADSKLILSIEPETVPAAVDAVEVEMLCRSGAGADGGLPPSVLLTRAEGFRATVTVPDAPGYYQLTYRSAARVGGERRPLPGGTFRYLMLHGSSGASAEVAEAGVGAKGGSTVGKVMTLDGDWMLATDGSNEGVARGWPSAPAPDAVPTRVPWIIQDAFPGYHGVAWYWREVLAPARPEARGRCLLRFEAVDYKADVWLNGTPVGGHEGGETPFELDVTEAARTDAPNLLAIRVVNPSNEPIDGLTLSNTPRRAKVIPYSAGASYDHGGIVGSVSIATVPQVYLTDLYLRPDTAARAVSVEATVRNAGTAPATARLDLTVDPASGGAALGSRALEAALPPGETVLRATIPVAEPHLWDLGDPFLYRVTARVIVGEAADERSDRCGFRDFRSENGYFRLNGRRVFLRSAHTVNATPVGQQVPGDMALFQRDIVYMKAMGMNCIRFIWGGATRWQLDLCDELGLMVYDEHAASNPMQPSPEMGERFDRSLGETIRRDRNHPSVVIWGVLNETQPGPAFDYALHSLPLVRSLDETRVVFLNSGRWDGRLDVGSLCNPGSPGWDAYLGGEGPGRPPTGWSPHGGYLSAVGDAHVYPRVPHTADTIRFLRTLGADTGPVFLSEYGIGSAVDLWRVTRHFEALGKHDAEDARFYRNCLDRFLADYDRWKLSECFAGPEEFFAESLRRMAGQRTLGLDAIRANPKIIGYNLTGMMDHVNCGEGLFTLFRELKPGTTDALFEGLAPLRLCLFAEPVNVYRGGSVRLEAVLANEDALRPGDYPVRLQVVGPNMARLLDRTVTVTVPPSTPESEAPLAIPFFDGEVTVDGPRGTYRFLATMVSGGAPTGGATAFRVDDAAGMPAIARDVVLLADDPALAAWLTERGTRVLDHLGADPKLAILVCGRPAGLESEEGWRALTDALTGGATVVFLTPDALAKGDDPTGRLPLEGRGTLRGIYSWLYLKDDWGKSHPVFDGLPSGGLLDFGVYREIVPDLAFVGFPAPDEAIAGAIKASQDYDSGLTLCSYRVGAGRLVLNTLRIRENLPGNPVAERLLRNLIAWAASPTQP